MVTDTSLTLSSKFVHCMLKILYGALFCIYASDTLILFLSITDGQCIATVSHDRTIKLWSVNSKDIQTMDVD